MPKRACAIANHHGRSMPETISIRRFCPADPTGWLQCRVLSFLDTPYYDDVRQTKEIYENPSIELIALAGNHVFGLIDLECDTETRPVCWKPGELGGSIWHLAVHPDFRRKGIGRKLLGKAQQIAARDGLARFETWTRGGAQACHRYEATDFEKVHAYLQVYFDHQEAEQVVQCRLPESRVIHGFCHYKGVLPPLEMEFRSGWVSIT